MPEIFGWEHLIYMAVSFTLMISALIFINKKVHGEKELVMIIRGTGLLLLACVVWNRFAICILRDGLNRLLPNTYCSFASFTFSFSVLFCKKDSRIFHFVLYLGLLGGISSMLCPNYLGQADSIFYPMPDASHGDGVSCLADADHGLFQAGTETVVLSSRGPFLYFSIRFVFDSCTGVQRCHGHQFPSGGRYISDLVFGGSSIHWRAWACFICIRKDANSLPYRFRVVGITVPTHTHVHWMYKIKNRIENKKHRQKRRFCRCFFMYGWHHVVCRKAF